jgi:hypothetical protein
MQEREHAWRAAHDSESLGGGGARDVHASIAPLAHCRMKLYAAAEQGHGEIVAGLVAAGADINAAKENGATPLFIAAHSTARVLYLCLL